MTPGAPAAHRRLDESGNTVSGQEVFEKQTNKLKHVLRHLAKIRDPRYAGRSSRLITQQQGLWYELVPMVVRELNARRPVNVSALIGARRHN